MEWLCNHCYLINDGSSKRCKRCPGVMIELKDCFKCDGLNSLLENHSRNCKLNWICPKCGVLTGSTERDCKLCKFSRPKTQKDIINGYLESIREAPYFSGVIRINNIFAPNTSHAIDYKSYSIIGLKYLSASNHLKSDLSVDILSAKVFSVRKYYNALLIVCGGFDINRNYRINPVVFTKDDSLKGHHILISQPITWFQIKLLFVAHLKEPDSLFSKLPAEVLHHILQFLII